MITAEMKTKWIAALKGPYADKKGEGSLCSESDYAYCCLGVLAEIQGGEFDKDNLCLLDGLYNPIVGALPPQYAAGLTGAEMGQLANVNDRTRTWGPVIAKIRALPTA